MPATGQPKHIGLAGYLRRVPAALRLALGLARRKYVALPGGFRYGSDGLFTRHNADFLEDAKFQRAYQLGIETLHGAWGDLHIEWRVYVACWAAAQALHLEGDFVECGVNTGVVSRAVMHYTDFHMISDRNFFLVDTFEGIPNELWTEAERSQGIETYNAMYRDCYDEVKATFAGFKNAVIVRGRVPEVLPQVQSQKVSYLSIDMNAAVPEIAAGEYFWPRLSPGAIVVLDDYGFDKHIEQKKAWDRFSAARGVGVLSLPTGQGLLIAPPA